jgi:signal transduction histidine kinase
MRRRIGCRYRAPVRALARFMERVPTGLLDAGLAIALAVVAVTELLQEEPPSYRVATVLGTALPLAWRRRYPLAMQLTQVFCAALTGRAPVPASLLALFVGLYSVGVYSKWRKSGLAVPIVGSAILGVLFPFSTAPPVPSWLLELIVGVGLWSAGNGVRERQAHAEVLEERARQLERERELATRVALSEERGRIARELHDVVAHSVSVMLVQAGAARTQLGRQPERAAGALREVETSGREALAELRRMLGLLTEVEATAELAPQPGLEQLERLVERVGQAGLEVNVQVAGEPRALPPGLDLTAYRIIQEALTNALKYAAGARTEVLVEYDPAELRLSIVDHGSASSGAGSGVAPGSGLGSGDDARGAGRGLLGMRERVAVYGGALEAGRRPEGGFAVRARLPLPSSS